MSIEQTQKSETVLIEDAISEDEGDIPFESIDNKSEDVEWDLGVKILHFIIKPC